MLNLFLIHLRIKFFNISALQHFRNYSHVTFFFNGGREQLFEGEERILVPSPKVATYDLKPEMSAFEVTEKLFN